jgi:hypothetical protein
MTALILASSMLFLFLFAGAVASLRGGSAGIVHAYSRTNIEYIGDIGRGGSIRALVAHYVDLLPTLSNHSRVHPPGPVALLWLLSYVVGRGPWSLSLATMAVATLSLPPLYLWVRTLAGPRAGVTACLLFVVSPGIVAFTATSADMLFMPFTLMTLYCFDRAIRHGARTAALAAGVFYALAALCSFNLLLLGLYFALAGLWEMRDASRRVPLVGTASVMLAGFLSVFLVMYLWLGFNIAACLQACWPIQVQSLSFQVDRWPSPAWLVLNPMAVLYYAGIPVCVLGVRRLIHPDATTRASMLIMILAFLLINCIVPARGEMERTGLFLYPFLIAPAAECLAAFWQKGRSEAPVAAVLAFMAFQCWLTEAMFQGYW